MPPHRATRPLHVLKSAPVAALAAALLASCLHAQAAAAPAVPRPVVVVLDPGHGGAPDDRHPDLPYDSGAVAPNGLQEKDVALDVARRTRALLQADDAVVVLTRDDDRYLDIPARTAVAVADRADVFVSIHFNGFADPTASGSVVLYPDETDHAFAGVMAAALDRALGPFGVQSRGVMLRDNWWIHIPCSVVTVEPMFMTNPAESRLLAGAGVRQALASALRDGIAAATPALAGRRAALEAYRATHGGALPDAGVQLAAAAPVSAAAPADSHADPPIAVGPDAAGAPAAIPAFPAGAGAGGGALSPWHVVALAAVLLVAVRLRRRLGVGAVRLSAGLLALVARLEGGEPPLVVERFSRQARRTARRRRVRERSRGGGRSAEVMAGARLRRAQARSSTSRWESPATASGVPSAAWSARRSSAPGAPSRTARLS